MVENQLVRLGLNGLEEALQPVRSVHSMEERVGDNPAEALFPESLHEEGFELITLVPYADIRDVKSVLCGLL